MSVQEAPASRRERLPADQRLQTANEIAARLDVSPEWVRREARKRHNPLPAIRLGRSVRFDWPAVREWAGIREES